ncbi:unnamed protein product [Rangifer tarandus platyrhynchus]|uniref:Uncharacterized protein n=1 Tax=Rangifer tarandus platyrhynchus TaxID=3082113 RepID=A0AC59YB77_RANTA
MNGRGPRFQADSPAGPVGSPGCWQQASALCPVGRSAGLLERPRDVVAGCPQREGSRRAQEAASGPEPRTDTGGGHPRDLVDSAACWPPARGPPSCSGEGWVHRTARGHSVDASGHVANWPGTPPQQGGCLETPSPQPCSPQALRQLRRPPPSAGIGSRTLSASLALPSRELAVCAGPASATRGQGTQAAAQVLCASAKTRHR